jgi:hypothetical protein
MAWVLVALACAGVAVLVLLARLFALFFIACVAVTRALAWMVVAGSMLLLGVLLAVRDRRRAREVR